MSFNFINLLALKLVNRFPCLGDNFTVNQLSNSFNEYRLIKN